MIPQRLVRTVPKVTTIEQELLWDRATRLHPEWSHITLRDPIDPYLFPITAKYWGGCESGAQLADLVRAEELYQRGGMYIDSDVEVYKPFDPLCGLEGVAAWEDCNVICNAVMGFSSGHPGLLHYLELAMDRQDEGTWESGVGTFTEVFKDRTDVLLLPPESFYPVNYRHRSMIPIYQMAMRESTPWTMTLHLWHHSWDGVHEKNLSGMA